MQLYPLIETHRTAAFGLWEATVRTPDGSTVTERGQTAQQAETIARHRAQKGDD